MTPVIREAPPAFYSQQVQETLPAKPLVFACSGCSFAGKLADGGAVTRHIRLHDHGVKKHQTPNGDVDVDGLAAQLTEHVKTR